MPATNGGGFGGGQCICLLLNYKGIYNASTNTPHLENGKGELGDWYLTTIAGTNNPTNKNLAIHETIVYNGTIWQSGGLISNTDDLVIAPNYIIIKGQKVNVGDTLTVAIGKLQGQIDSTNDNFTNYYTKTESDKILVDALKPIIDKLADTYTKQETDAKIQQAVKPITDEYNQFVTNYNARTFKFNSPDGSMEFTATWDKETNSWIAEGTAKGGGGSGDGNMHDYQNWVDTKDYPFNAISNIPVVIFENKLYVAISKPTKGKTPNTDSAWLCVSIKGDTGPQGPAGAKGDTGPQGPAGKDGQSVLYNLQIVNQLLAGTNIEFAYNNGALTINSKGGGSGITDITAGLGISIDKTDPNNPKINLLTALPSQINIQNGQTLSPISTSTKSLYDVLSEIASKLIQVSGGTTGLTFSKKTGTDIYELSGALDIINGGTGAFTQAGACRNILPSQSGKTGNFLKSDGTNASWNPLPVNSIKGQDTATAKTNVVDDGKGNLTISVDAQSSSSNSIPLYNFVYGTGYIVTYDTAVIPSVTVVTVKDNVVPSKEISVSIPYILDSFYPDSFKYLIVCINLGSTTVKINGTDTTVSKDLIQYIRLSYDMKSPPKTLYVDTDYISFKFDPSVIYANQALCNNNQQLINFKAKSYTDAGTISNYPNLIDNTNPSGTSWNKTNNIGTGGLITLSPQETLIYDGRQINAGSGVAQFVIDMQKNIFSNGFSKLLLFKCEVINAIPTSVLKLVINANVNKNIVSNIPYKILNIDTFEFNFTITAAQIEKDSKRYVAVQINCTNNNIILTFSQY